MMSFLDSADDDPKRANRRPLLFFVLVTEAIGALASVFTEPNIEGWYAGLLHPSFAPPNWVFAPVWATLYALMAVAAWRVWRITGTKSPEMIAYALQLIFNFAWSAIFFAAHQIEWAFIEICVLVALILATTILFWKRDRLAGLLFLPYLGWTSFAAFLTYAFWTLNP
jgi:tryptophan-rich sensory protein